MTRFHKSPQPFCKMAPHSFLCAFGATPLALVGWLIQSALSCSVQLILLVMTSRALGTIHQAPSHFSVLCKQTRLQALAAQQLWQAAGPAGCVPSLCVFLQGRSQKQPSWSHPWPLIHINICETTKILRFVLVAYRSQPKLGALCWDQHVDRRKKVWDGKLASKWF